MLKFAYFSLKMKFIKNNNSTYFKPSSVANTCSVSGIRIWATFRHDFRRLKNVLNVYNDV